MQVGYAEIAILSLYLASLRDVNAATGQMLSIRRRPTTVPVGCDTYRSYSKRRRLLMAGKNGEMFMTRSFNVTPKTTEQHLGLIARTVAYVINNLFCTIEANY